MKSLLKKRTALVDLTNIDVDIPIKVGKTDLPITAIDLMPDLLNDDLNIPNEPTLERQYQNLHPMLPWYKFDLDTGKMSYQSLNRLLHEDNELELFDFLTYHCLMPEGKQCVFCGGAMRKKKDGKHWFWICTKRVDGVKCNKGKLSIRKGTIFDNRKLTTQQILLIFWHLVHHLSVSQCAQYTNISDKNNTTVCHYYKFCREVCSEWFWDPTNTPKLGGFGKIVEMDESFFPGKPKYNRGRRLGDEAWEEDDKWVFGLTERGSLDVVAVQVPSNRSRISLLPIINNHCNPGTIFCSDGWKAYNKLADNLDLDDVLHYSVNHSKNYVDPETGAHTQTIEGFWRQFKAWLPNFGLKPADLSTYIGFFCWYLYCKQRKVDFFLHLLRCISNKRPFLVENLPNATMHEVDV